MIDNNGFIITKCDVWETPKPLKSIDNFINFLAEIPETNKLKDKDEHKEI